MLKQTFIYIILSAFTIGCFYGCGKNPIGNNSKITKYTRSAPRMRLANVRNASGITFNHDTNTLFLIEDSPSVIREINEKGKILRSIQMEKMDDTEGIAYLGNKRFALIEESTSKIYFCSIDKKTTNIKLKDMVTLAVPSPPSNTGLEGITYDPEMKCLYVIKEKDPKKIFRVYLGTEKIEEPWDLENININDASDICFDTRTGHLLILSHESRSIVECTTKGKELARISLKKGQSNLKRNFEKPEGITIDPKTGKIFTCGEKDEFYIFAEQK